MSYQEELRQQMEEKKARDRSSKQVDELYQQMVRVERAPLSSAPRGSNPSTR